MRPLTVSTLVCNKAETLASVTSQFTSEVSVHIFQPLNRLSFINTLALWNCAAAKPKNCITPTLCVRSVSCTRSWFTITLSVQAICATVRRYFLSLWVPQPDVYSFCLQILIWGFLRCYRSSVQERNVLRVYPGLWSLCCFPYVSHTFFVLTFQKVFHFYARCLGYGFAESSFSTRPHPPLCFSGFTEAS